MIRLYLVMVALVAVVSVAPAEAADPVNGRKVYVEKCARCHGEKGRGDGPKADALPKKAMDYTDKKKMAGVTDAQLRQTLLEGSAPMPAYKGRLRDEDVDDVIAYIRTFAGQ